MSQMSGTAGSFTALPWSASAGGCFDVGNGRRRMWRKCGRGRIFRAPAVCPRRVSPSRVPVACPRPGGAAMSCGGMRGRDAGRRRGLGTGRIFAGGPVRGRCPLWALRAHSPPEYFGKDEDPGGGVWRGRSGRGTGRAPARGAVRRRCGPWSRPRWRRRYGPGWCRSGRRGSGSGPGWRPARRAVPPRSCRGRGCAGFRWRH